MDELTKFIFEQATALNKAIADAYQRGFTDGKIAGLQKAKEILKKVDTNEICQ